MTPDMWGMLRLPKTTLHRLERYRARLTVAVRSNPARYPEFLHDNPLSMGSAVLYLLHQQDRHTARNLAAKLAKARKHA